MKFEKGKLYVSRYNTVKDDPKHNSIHLIIMCTGPGEESKWANYKTVAGVVIENSDPTGSISIGTHSTTWNAEMFSEELDQEIVLSNKNWKPEPGHSPG